MLNSEVEKAEVFITVEIIEYIPHSIVIKTILKKTTGNVSVLSFDSGEGLSEKTTSYDTFTQIIDGQAEMVIDGEKHLLKTGDAIVIPAHSPSHINSNGRFKMIQTIIKSGYE